ncbi:hypothetical protein J4447_03815 [Candidatus Pacearchaeota archaeon]|nr:hypothetical protein [Candidatus Pacearchaeota archaeon]
MISPYTIDRKTSRAFGLVKADMNRIFSILEQIQKDLAKMKGTDIEVADQLIGISKNIQKVRHETDTALKEAETAKEEAKEALVEAEDIKKYKPKPIVKTKVVYKKSSKSTKFVAARGGKKFHHPSCPFAKNILPKKKIIFKSKETALNNGYKECKCLLR